MSVTTSPSELVQRLYHVRQSSKLGRIVEQVDAVARLLLKIFGADFVVVFYSRSAGTGMIPVACHTLQEGGVDEFALLESAFSSAATKGLRRGVTEFAYSGSPEGDTLAQFAGANQFAVSFQYPLMVGGELRGSVVAFWREKPEKEKANSSYLLGTSAELLANWISMVEEAQSVDSFSLRLSMLIALYDLPLDEYPITDLAGQMARIVQYVIRGSSVAVIARELATGKYRVSACEGVQAQDAILRDALAQEVGAVLDQVRTGRHAPQPWYDLSDQFKGLRRNVVVVEVLRDERYHLAIAFCRDDITGFAVNDLDLISVFRMFAESIVTNALLVRNLQKNNQKILETTGRIADAETMAALADMSSGIAHDLNNTIGAVVGRLQLLKLKNTDEKLGISLDKIEASALEAANTISRLQQFSTSVKARPSTLVDLVTFYDNYGPAPHTWREEAERRQVTVQFSRDLDAGSVNGSLEDLVAILDRLLQNAVEFTAEGSTVLVALTGTERSFCLQVADSGPGIPEGIRHKVFYPFFSTKSVRGAGLGLSVVYGVTSRLGGKVQLICPPEGGTVAQVTFPRLVDGKEVSDISRRILKTRKLNVLLVDDDEQIREILSDMLSIEGHTTVCCSDGQAALTALSGQSFDLMITDLGMPGISGMELASQAHARHRAMPIILITGWGTQLNPDEINRNGIQALIPKPFHLRDIKSRIMDLTAQRPESAI